MIKIEAKIIKVFSDQPRDLVVILLSPERQVYSGGEGWGVRGEG